MGPQIIITQNSPENQANLIAQQKMYSEGKILQGIHFTVSVIIIILLTFLKIILLLIGIDISWVLAFYSLFAIITGFLLEEMIIKLKHGAAQIQELFDCNVLDIEWNYNLISSKPDPEIIFKYYKKSNFKPIKGLSTIDWYSVDIQLVNDNVAKFICQRSNCYYDTVLKQKMKSRIILFSIISFFIVVFGAMLGDITLIKFILNVITPLLPLYIFSFKLFIEFNRSRNGLIELRSIINRNWDLILNKDTRDLDKMVRQIQDRLYLNRKNSPLVPDFFYKRLRKSNEDEMNYSVKQLAEEYLKKN
jgi:hypothetical protein